MSVAQKAAEARRKRPSSAVWCGPPACLRAGGPMGRPEARTTPSVLLLDARLYPSGEERAQRTAHGDCGQSLSVAFDGEQRGGEAAGEKNQRAEDEVLKVVSHVVAGGLDCR